MIAESTSRSAVWSNQAVDTEVHPSMGNVHEPGELLQRPVFAVARDGEDDRDVVLGGGPGPDCATYLAALIEAGCGSLATWPFRVEG